MSRGAGTNTVNTVDRQGEIKCRVDQLRIGQKCDLQSDQFADAEAYDAFCSGEDGEAASQHPEFQFEYETVMEIERETADCICITFESGFTCGFPVDHEIGVDPEQDVTLLS